MQPVYPPNHPQVPDQWLLLSSLQQMPNHLLVTETQALSQHHYESARQFMTFELSVLSNTRCPVCEGVGHNDAECPTSLKVQQLAKCSPATKLVLGLAENYKAMV